MLRRFLRMGLLLLAVNWSFASAALMPDGGMPLQAGHAPAAQPMPCHGTQQTGAASSARSQNADDTAAHAAYQGLCTDGHHCCASLSLNTVATLRTVGLPENYAKAVVTSLYSRNLRPDLPPPIA